MSLPPFQIWLAAARFELSLGNEDTARSLLKRAARVAPSRMRSQVFLELSRLEEFTGNTDCARRLLEFARQTKGADWKVFLEAVHLEQRDGNLTAAVRTAT